jgi:hypothetical protein
MSTNVIETPPAAAENPQPAPAPEAILQQLRAIRAQLGEFTPLTPAQRKALQDNRTRASNPVLQASINVIDVTEVISTAVGQPAAVVRQLFDEANRWTAVEDELRAMLNGVSGANLLRRQRIAHIAAQASGLGAQLAKDPAHAGLVPHVLEIRRLRKTSRRKKAATDSDSTGQPAPGTTDSPKA